MDEKMHKCKSCGFEYEEKLGSCPKCSRRYINPFFTVVSVIIIQLVIILCIQAC